MIFGLFKTKEPEIEYGAEHYMNNVEKTRRELHPDEDFSETLDEAVDEEFVPPTPNKKVPKWRGIARGMAVCFLTGAVTGYFGHDSVQESVNYIKSIPTKIASYLARDDFEPGYEEEIVPEIPKKEIAVPEKVEEKTLPKEIANPEVYEKQEEPKQEAPAEIKQTETKKIDYTGAIAEVMKEKKTDVAIKLYESMDEDGKKELIEHILGKEN